MQAAPSDHHPEPGLWLTDPGKSTVAFRTRNFIGMKVEGRFTEVDGAVEVAESPIESSVRVSIPVKGVDTGSGMRDRDLLKKSVFYADEWPDIRFESTDIHAAGDAPFTITGELRVRDRTDTVEVEAARAESGSGEHHYTASCRVNPRGFGIPHPFIRRDVEIMIDVWLVRTGE